MIIRTITLTEQKTETIKGYQLTLRAKKFVDSKAGLLLSLDSNLMVRTNKSSNQYKTVFSTKEIKRMLQLCPELLKYFEIKEFKNDYKL